MRCFMSVTRWIGLVTLVSVMGCVTVPRQSPDIPVKMTLSEAGVITFMGEIVELDQLPKRMHQAGCLTRQEIQISLVGEKHNLQAMKSLENVLMKNGYRWIDFRGAKNATSYVVDGPAAIPQNPTRGNR